MMKKQFFIPSLFFFLSLFLNAQTNTFPTNGNVGIGTTSPSSFGSNQPTLDLRGSSIYRTGSIMAFSSDLSKGWSIGRADDSSLPDGLVISTSDVAPINFRTGTNTRLTIHESGNVGIGTVNPNDKLHVNGNTTLNIYHGTTQGHLNFRQGQPVTDVAIVTAQHGLATYNGLRINGTNGVSIGTNNGVERLRVTSSGNVGIGTTDTKGFKLGVNGKIAATEVKVATYANWADFVFKSDYDLPTLKEVEQHIKENGHLKDIPNADEVKKEGFFLAEMNAKLLQKIEELTLYTIAQQKELQNQEAINKNLEERLQKLEALLTSKN